MTDAISRSIPGRHNRGLRKRVRDIAHSPNAGVGYRTPEELTQIIARRIALTPWGRASVLAAFRSLAIDCGFEVPS